MVFATIIKDQNLQLYLKINKLNFFFNNIIFFLKKYFY